MRIIDIVESKPFGWGSEKSPKTVVKSTSKPKIVPPTTSGFSKHPYQGKLVGEEVKDVEEDGKLSSGAKDPCWKGHEMVGMKTKNGKKVPNCVPKK